MCRINKEPEDVSVRYVLLFVQNLTTFLAVYMNGLILIVISIVVLALAYLFYGRYLARVWGIDPSKKTPAYEFKDGKDYIPTLPSVVFGNHFASIAGAGPITGPIIAAMFGWLPVFLWLWIFGCLSTPSQ